eukprot:TRINITY_DN946_c0_g1_i1.p1 TRINITY_DN946_c0_g1~~TRINITY_DN946_c0_g1_i1.p1  ORF type:complete len:366 (+),score=100.37 TRINITY_DN946_c0_g1_i1:157-1254(+)
MAGRGPMPHPFARSFPGPGIRPEPFGPPLGRPVGPHPFDMFPPDVLEQKLVVQATEMQKLAKENQRLAASHSILRQDLAAAQHEIERVHSRMAAIQNEKEQQLRGMLETKAKMEADIQAVEMIKADLQQAHADAQNLVSSRQELTAQVHQLTQELQRATTEVQHIPAMHAEIDSLSQELQRARSTYEYEKAASNAQAEKNQTMEKNLLSMAREVEKLRAEIGGVADRRSRDTPYGAGYGSHDIPYSAGHNAYGHPQMPMGSDSDVTYAARGGPGWGAYDVPRGVPGSSGYDIPRGGSGGAGYDVPRGGPGGVGYDIPRGGPGSASYDIPRGGPGGVGYDVPRGGSGGPGYDVPRGGSVGAGQVRR